jgi:WD40 repeat protein
LIHIYGKYGIDYTFYMRPDIIIGSLEFAVNQGWLIGICIKIVNNVEKYFMCIWSLRECALKHQIELKNNMKRITCLHAPIDSNYCYIGMENDDGSNYVRAIHIGRGELSDSCILRKPNLDQNPSGSITCIQTHPTIDNYLLVGYENGDVVLFNVLQHHIHPCGLVFRNGSSVTSMSWHPKKQFFFVGTASGDINLWNLDKKKELQIEQNTSALFTKPDLIFNCMCCI